MKIFWRNNGLSITMFSIFAVLLFAESAVGWHHENNLLLQEHSDVQSYAEYLRSGAFLEVTMQNWQSEFLARRNGCAQHLSSATRFTGIETRG